MKLFTLACAFIALPSAAFACGPAHENLKVMESEGYQITFTDISGDWIVMLLERKDKAWILVEIKGDMLCIKSGGADGHHVTPKPNA